MKLLMIKGYYGVNIHGDGHGDLGCTVYDGNINPDIVFIMAATIAHNSEDIELEVIDAVAEELLADEMLKELERKEKEYNSIIIKACAPTIKLDLELAQKLKEIFPKAHVSFSGHIAKLLREWIKINAKYIDEIIDIPLDFYMYKIVNAAEKVELSKFPCMDYTLFPYEKYRDQGKLRLSIQTSRGCMMGCGYCPYNAFYENKIYYYDIEKVIEDIKCVMKLEPEVILFRDQYFTADKERIRRLCERIIQENIKIKWTCETRIEFLDESLIDLMVEAGLFMICFGVESGDNKLLNKYNRSASNYQNIPIVVSYLQKKGVLTLGFYIIGFLEDTWESTENTLKRALEVNSDIAQFSPFEPCVPDRKKRAWLVPDNFVLFENIMDNDIKRNLCQEEVDYLVNAYSLIYNCIKGELKNNYINEYVKKKEHTEEISYLQKINTGLKGICSAVRGKEWERKDAI